MLASVVVEAAARFGDAVALVGPDGRPLTYRDLDLRSDRVAAGLVRRGVGPGDVVALDLPASVEYVVAYAAAAKAGAATVGVNPRLVRAERATLLELAGPRVALHEREEVGELERTATDERPVSALPVDPDRPVAVVFTSGTTGSPKAAVFANRQLDAIRAVDMGDAWGGGGRSLASTSLAHLGFMTKLPSYLRAGGTTWLVERWRADIALDVVEQVRLTSFGGMPTQLALVLGEDDFDRRDTSSVAAIVLGGGPASIALLREGRDRFGGRPMVSARYSSTETGGCGTGTAFDDPLDEDPGVGFPRGPIRVGILDDDDRPAGTGEVGHLVVWTPTAMTGYWRDPVATASAFTADGAVRTGDLGRLDDAGRLFLSGRSNEMYIRGGYNVFPAEVERVLAEHPAVAAVAVVTRPDPVMGERAIAVVVPHPGAPLPDLASIRAAAAGRLSSYKLPDELRIVGALPLTTMHKVDRRALTEMVAD